MLGDRDFETVTKSDAQSLHASMRKTPGSANYALCVLGSLYHRIISDWELSAMRHPTAGIKRFKMRTRERFLTPEERQRVHEAIQAGLQIPQGRKGHLEARSVWARPPAAQPDRPAPRRDRRAAVGEAYLDPSVAGQAVALPAQIHGEPTGEALSERETDVLRLVAHGLLNKEIAARLQLDAPTVEDSKRGAMAKLGVTTRAGVVRHALEQGWLA